VTAVPLPDTPCLRVRLVYNEASLGEAGNRFYLSYGGSAPTGANCTTLASDIEAAWLSHLAPLINEEYYITEVDVLDIATDSGKSGVWSGSVQATRAGNAPPFQCATNVEYDIDRRYRGGKPRIYLPPGLLDDMADPAHWDSGFISAVNSGVGAFFSAVEALSVGAVGTLAHVNLSYYQGFTNITNSSGRERAVPTYRSEAKHDVVQGYACKGVIGSQKRRRTSTTP